MNMSTKDYNDKKKRITGQRVMTAISPVISWLECAKWIWQKPSHVWPNGVMIKDFHVMSTYGIIWQYLNTIRYEQCSNCANCT